MAINTTFTAGSILTAAQMNNLPWGVISRTYNTSATLTVNSSTETALFNAPAFTPVAGRLYRITYSIGFVYKTNANGNVDVRLRKDSTAGTLLNGSTYSALGVNVIVPFSTSILLTSTEMGTTSFAPTVTVVANSSGFIAANTGGNNGTILVEDIGAA
jgi:hypothetical protein